MEEGVNDKNDDENEKNDEGKKGMKQYILKAPQSVKIK